MLAGRARREYRLSVMPCGSVRDGPWRHGQSHGPSGRRSPTAAAAAGPCDSQPPLNGRLAWRVQKWSLFCPEPDHSCRLLLGRVHTAAPSTRVPVYACRLLVAHSVTPQLRTLRLACAVPSAMVLWLRRLQSCASGRPHRRYRSTSEVPSSVHSAPCAAAAPRGRGAGGVSKCADHTSAVPT